MARLGVNVDHVATLREARKIKEPDPVSAAAIAELAGADSITVHLREDRRHINDRDLYILRKTVKTKLNLEMAATEEILKIVLDIKPDQVTLVPERREEITTEGGLNVIKHKSELRPFIKRLKDSGIIVSLFVDPDLQQVKESKNIGADFIEIHTGSFCNSFGTENEEREFKNIINSINTAIEVKIGINAGHGINYQNVKRLAGIKEIHEFNIGHSIISRAIFVGIYQAVKDMVELLKGQR